MLRKQETQNTDLLLWLAILLGPLAIGVNTVVGYTVAHWACDVNYKRMSFLVSAIDFALCLCAFALSLALFRSTPRADESLPAAGRRSFMAKSGMVLSVMSVLVVIAGTAALFILNPCD
jgi:ABC-type sulfate transport system permease subunit